MDIENLNKFLQEFQKESNRAAAVLGVCYLDKMIENLLKRFLIQEPKFIEKYILGNSSTAAIDSFAKKIRTAYALGLLRQEEYDDLETIRTIRNDFAHELHRVSFETQSIKDRCFNLKIAQAAIKGSLSKAKYTDSSRLRYTLAVGVIGNFLNYRTQNDIANRKVLSDSL